MIRRLLSITPEAVIMTRQVGASRLVEKNPQWHADQAPAVFKRHFSKGVSAESDHNFKVAIEHFQDAIHSLPKDADPMYRLTCEQWMCRIQKDLQLLEEARSSDALSSTLKPSSRKGISRPVYVMLCVVTLFESYRAYLLHQIITEGRFP